MRAVLLGPPGSGKGTLARPLCEEFDAKHIATGDLFRAEIASGSPLGVLANGFIAFGNLVPDDVTNAMIRERISRPNVPRFVLDGYPRTTEQAAALEAMLQELDRPLDAALLLDVPDDLIVARAVGRQVCSVCGEIHHLEFKPPRVAGVCDVCSGVLGTREDDRPSTVRHRLAVYHRTTAPVIDFYRERDLLVSLPAGGNAQSNLVTAVEILSRA